MPISLFGNTLNRTLIEKHREVYGTEYVTALEKVCSDIDTHKSNYFLFHGEVPLELLKKVQERIEVEKSVIGLMKIKSLTE